MKQNHKLVGGFFFKKFNKKRKFTGFCWICQITANKPPFYAKCTAHAGLELRRESRGVRGHMQKHEEKHCEIRVKYQK